MVKDLITMQVTKTSKNDHMAVSFLIFFLSMSPSFDSREAQILELYNRCRQIELQEKPSFWPEDLE